MSLPLDGPPTYIDGHPVWQRQSGTTVADLTLSPSYLVPELVHGWIREGQWIDCGDIP